MDIRSRFPGMFDEHGHVRWPEDPAARTPHARELFYAVLASNLDSVYQIAADWVLNPDPAESFPRDDDLSHRDRAYRDGFAALTVDQRALVLKLVRHVQLMSLFNVTVDVDQWPYGRVHLELENDGGPAAGLRVPLTTEHGDLHELFLRSIAEKSHFSDVFFSRRAPHSHSKEPIIEPI